MRSRLNSAVILVPIVVALLSLTGFLRHARDSVSDLLFSGRQVPDNVVIIAIDEQSIHAVGQWPWPRAVYADALAKLQFAKAIGIDVNFKEPSGLGMADDAVFGRALSASKVPVILASELQPDGTVIRPIAVLASASAQGLANITVDADGITRSVRLQRGGVPFLAAAVAGDAQPSSTTPVRINYLGPSGTVPSYSFIDLIQGKVPSVAIQDKMVFIGATAHDLQDYQNTPFGLMSGVEIQSTVAVNTVANDFLRSLPFTNMLLTLGAGLIALGAVLTMRRTSVIVFVLVLLTIAVWVGVFVLFDHGIVADLVMPTAAIAASTAAAILLRYNNTSRERRFIHDTFSRYLAPQVVAALMEDPSRVRLGGERRELTILFSDIRGFTSLSETMQPTQLAHFLNRYLGYMTDIVMDRQGVVDKYIGDAVMAFWGAPLDDHNHALHGVVSAVAMMQALEKFNMESKKEGLPAIATGIGLNTGAVTVGNMGSEKRFDYTVIGDEVNLASRLESLTKLYGVNIVVSGSVIENISADYRKQHDLTFREIDRVRVKGKTQPVTIYEVVTSPIGSLELFDGAREQYYAGRWDEAIAGFDQFLQQTPGDGPAQLLKERCQGFLHRPAEGWDGVFNMQHK